MKTILIRVTCPDDAYDDIDDEFMLADFVGVPEGFDYELAEAAIRAEGGENNAL